MIQYLTNQIIRGVQKILGSNDITIQPDRNLFLNSLSTYISSSLVSIVANGPSGSIQLSSTDVMYLNGKVINLNLIKIGSLTTSQILALTVSLGTLNGYQIFNSTNNQMYFYQNSPISGTTPGWYNLTGTLLV